MTFLLLASLERQFVESKVTLSP